MRRFGDLRRRTWASDHERARQRAAERLALPLPAAEVAWLDAHLKACSPCAQVAEQYAAVRERLRDLRPIDPPRDLWARTSAALDRAEQAEAGRGLPASAASYRGRHRPIRSLRSLRAERHASRIGRFRGPGIGRLGRGAPRSANPGWAFPFATLAVLALAVATGGLLLNGTPRGGVPRSPAGSATAEASGPGATPITITTAQVAWLSPNLSGGYRLNLASVEQVCPDDARYDCAPMEGSEAQNLPAFAVQPAAVVRSPSKRHLVVVDRLAKTGGGSVYVVAMPASVTVPEPTDGPPASVAVPSVPPTTAAPTPDPTVGPGGGPSVDPSVEPTPDPDPTDAPTPDASPGPAVDPSPSVEPGGGSPTTTPVPTIVASLAPAVDPSGEPTPDSSPDPDPSPVSSGEPGGPDVAASPDPSATAAIAIISGVILVGESADYSPDGSMFAFSARPADGSHGPDIYVWLVGDAQARPLTSDHGSIFSGWAGSQILGSRAAVAGDPGLPTGSAPPGPGTSPDPGNSPGPGTSPDPGTSPGASGPAAGRGRVGAAVAADDPATGHAVEAQVALVPRIIAEIGAARARLVPRTAIGAIEPTPTPAAEPSVVPSTDPSDDAGQPTEPALEPEGGESGPAAPDAVDAAVPVSFLIDPITGVERALAATPAWRPVVDPTGRFVVFWVGTLRYDPAMLAWRPAAGGLHLAPWSVFASADAIEVPAVPLFDDALDSAGSLDWDARWNESGDHLAVWIADPQDPAIGRLSLLAVDPGGNALAAPGVLLRGEPALPGFSISGDRLAWATPPGQDGEGSRIQVMAWSGEHAGQIVSQPASRDEEIIVVR